MEIKEWIFLCHLSSRAPDGRENPSPRGSADVRMNQPISAGECGAEPGRLDGHWGDWVMGNQLWVDGSTPKGVRGAQCTVAKRSDANGVGTRHRESESQSQSEERKAKGERRKRRGREKR